MDFAFVQLLEARLRGEQVAAAAVELTLVLARADPLADLVPEREQDEPGDGGDEIEQVLGSHGVEVREHGDIVRGRPPMQSAGRSARRSVVHCRPRRAVVRLPA